jgi:hypothetical protein
MMKLFCISLLTILSGICFPKQNGSTIDGLLKAPFDLQQFKKKKGQSNSGRRKPEPYYFKPTAKGMYFGFFLFRINSDNPDYAWMTEQGISIITYKPYGKYQNDYLDPTETLIEIQTRCNDDYLPELAFIGMDSLKIKHKLGDPFLRKNNCFIYSKGTSSLVLKFANKSVMWVKYTHLNSSLTAENISEGLTAGD